MASLQARDTRHLLHFQTQGSTNSSLLYGATGERSWIEWALKGKSLVCSLNVRQVSQLSDIVYLSFCFGQRLLKTKTVLNNDTIWLVFGMHQIV